MFLDELNPCNEDELEFIQRKGQAKDKEMIVVNLKKEKEKHSPTCTKPKFLGDKCCCGLKFYRVRPYTFQFLSVIQQFYEIIGMAELSFKELNQIVEHFEMYLNIPIAEKNAVTIQQAKNYSQSLRQNRNKRFVNPLEQCDRIGRFRPKILQPKIIFKLLICRNNYHYFPQIEQTLQNLRILMKNRDPPTMVIISSDPIILVSGMDQGFCSIPISSPKWYNEDDIMLNLLENYLIKLKFYKDTKAKNINDFGNIMQIRNEEENDSDGMDQQLSENAHSEAHYGTHQMDSKLSFVISRRRSQGPDENNLSINENSIKSLSRDTS